MLNGTYGLLAGSSLSGRKAPKTKSIKSNPFWAKYKAAVDAAPTFYDKLKVIQVEQGLYAPWGKVSPEMKVRQILSFIILEDLIWGAQEAGQKVKGGAQDVVCVLRSALMGIPDASYYGVLVPTGANIQASTQCDTKLNIEDALDAVEEIDPKVAKLLYKGIYDAVPAKYSAYKDLLAENFQERFTEQLLAPLKAVGLGPGVMPWIVGAAVVTLILIYAPRKKT